MYQSHVPSAMAVTATFRRYLVDHPVILNFEWDPQRTLGSTWQFTALSVLAYVVLTLLLRSRAPRVPPAVLRPVAAAHSLALAALSLVMAAGAALSVAAAPSPHDAALCLPPGTPPRGPLFFWAHVFFLSKLLEFGDTALIVLSGPDAVRRRLTPLHVYHHATVVVMCRLWLGTRQSLFPVALTTNSAVHVAMYGYYFLAAAGARPPWKRAVTDLQIAQFVFSFAVSLRMLYLHLFSGSGSGCSGFWGWCFNAAFNASLLALFLDFHAKSYKNRNSNNDDKAKAA